MNAPIRRRIARLLTPCIAAAALLATASSVARSQSSGTVSLAGSLFKISAGQTQSTPVSGAAVYLHAPGAAAADWIGPNLTDLFGRYEFYNLPPGLYAMRIFSGTIRLWEQVVTLPAKLPPIVIRDIRVVYYPKAADRGLVVAVLEKLNLPYDQAAPSSNLATNTIWFGDGVALSDMRAVANALIQNGVSLRAIRRFTIGNDWRAKVIEIGASPAHVTGATLTAAEVNATSSFPRAEP